MLPKIIQYFKPYISEGICIAFSGGVDSSLLLKAACLTREEFMNHPSQNTSAIINAEGTTFSINVCEGNTQTASIPYKGNSEAAIPSCKKGTKTTFTTYKENIEAVSTSCKENTKAAVASCKENTNAAITSDRTNTPKILAIIAETRLHPHEDTLQARELAVSMGADCLVLSIDEFSDPQIMDNPTNRCYLCKRLLFSSIRTAALDRGCHHVFDGTNQDDTKEYRPGLAALEELHIHSPLKELHLSKTQVRELSRQLQLTTFDKPSTPCMATRLPYGARLDFDLLDRIHQGETALRKLGFYNVRLRFHQPLVRIEVDTPDFPRILEHREEILSCLKELGFTYLTLDLEGFRSGSMDVGLNASRV